MYKANATWSDAGGRLDRISYGPFHRRLLALIGAGMFLDGYELYMAGGVMAALVSNGFSTMNQNGYFVSATFIGMLVGACSAGILGDRFGRRFTYQFNLLMFGLASIGAFFAPNIEVLIGLRFLMGVGLGAEVVCSFAMLSEFVPSDVRGRAIGWLAFFTNLPLLVTGFLSVWIIPHFGWRYMFLIGGVAALIVWVLRKNMPESPRWLETKGRFAEADEILKKIESEGHVLAKPAGVTADPAFVNVPQQEAVSIWVLFSRPVIGRTLLGMYLHCVVNFCFYGFVGWMPTFLVKQGNTVATSLLWTTVMAIGAPTGAFIGLTFSDRIGRKPAIMTACLFAVLFGAVMPLCVGHPYFLMATGFLLFTAIYVLHAVGYALYVPETFPTLYRFRAMGVCSSTARLATAGIQTAVVALFAWQGVVAIVGMLDAFLLVLAVVVGVFGIETKGRSLEDISGNAALLLSTRSEGTDVPAANAM